MVENVELSSDGLAIAGQLYLPDVGTPPFPAVIVCHGLGSRSANHQEFAAYLGVHGWGALLFDFRGHGASEGALDEGTVNDVLAAAAFLEARPDVNHDRIAVRGSSLGGYLAIQAAAVSPALRAVVAVRPAPEDLLLSFFRQAPMPGASVEDYQFRANQASFVLYLDGHSQKKAARAVAPRALMLVHAKGDESIDYQNTVELYNLAGDPKRLLLRVGGSHHTAQHERAVHDETLVFLNESLPERP